MIGVGLKVSIKNSAPPAATGAPEEPDPEVGGA